MKSATPFRRLLIANRGEVAVRIARAAALLGLPTLAVYPQDDARCRHVAMADAAVRLSGEGVSAYLDIEQILSVAVAQECDALHPGYGFLSENALLASRCAEQGVQFVGPAPEHLALFGDKMLARQLAQRCGVAVAVGTSTLREVADARHFLRSLGPGAAIMLKAVAGGGGRGIRIVRTEDDLTEAWARCRSEALAAFGNEALYAEQLVDDARHVEVQVLADHHGGVVALGERDCTLQRRHQKLIEMAPSRHLPPATRSALVEAALALARKVGYRNLGTFEFLVGNQGFVFTEANPRLQVEHTVTEAVFGIDLVQAQLRVAAGDTLDELGLAPGQLPSPRGHAIQMRINMERIDATGQPQPAAGRLTAFDLPSGPGVRTDTLGYTGYKTSTRYDSLLAKVIVHSVSPDPADALALARRSLEELRIEGVSTNVAFLQALLNHPDVQAGRLHTRFIEEQAAVLAAAAEREWPSRSFHDGESLPTPGVDALAPAADGAARVEAPVVGRIVSIDAAPGQAVRAGQQLAVVEAMKMEMVVSAERAGRVVRVLVAVGDQVDAGQALIHLEADDSAPGDEESTEETAPELRPELEQVLQRKTLTQDDGRAAFIARRHARGQRSARENLADLCDAGSFVEYGALALAAQRTRRSLDELIMSTPADGFITGIARVNGQYFEDARSRCAVMAYDPTVLAGTQGHVGHLKLERIARVAEQWRLPVVLFAEGGGGRPGDNDVPRAAGLTLQCFSAFARLNGLVPLVGVAAGFCFAGNAALLGCCDVVIATRDASIGMAGPAMIEGAGLGAVRPQDVGPVVMQSRNGVVDVVVEDETQAVAVAKQYLSYFQGARDDWQASDQSRLRQAVPANRLRGYDIRPVLHTLADTGSVLELRREFAPAMITALVRVEGRALAVIANNPLHLGGAIDAEAADKASRFLQLCNAFGLPVLSLCDTPGFMVGPRAETTALVRHVCRMFVNASRLTAPLFCITLRKAYGLGAMAMAGGSLHGPQCSVAWPSAEVGSMGIEGGVRLAYKHELRAMADPQQRQLNFERMVKQALEQGSALNAASHFEFDDVIDPAMSREWLAHSLRAVPPARASEGSRRHLDTW